MQAVQLLLMYGAETLHLNKYRQPAESLTTNEECLALFAQVRRDGELCRQELREKLETLRERNRRVAQDALAMSDALCASHINFHVHFTLFL
jgi:hypothetical protein